MDDQQLLRYSRHILLNEIGVEGQARIRAASMLIIGAGGLGSPAAFYLASAGVGRIVLVDGDAVDLTNLQRQILHTTGQNRKLEGGNPARPRLARSIRGRSARGHPTCWRAKSWGRLCARRRWCSTAPTTSPPGTL